MAGDCHCCLSPVQKLAFKTAYLKSNIRPGLVWEALDYLKDTALYKHEQITVRRDWDYIPQAEEAQLAADEQRLNDLIAGSAGPPAEPAGQQADRSQHADVLQAQRSPSAQPQVQPQSPSPSGSAA